MVRPVFPFGIKVCKLYKLFEGELLRSLIQIRPVCQGFGRDDAFQRISNHFPAFSKNRAHDSLQSRQVSVKQSLISSATVEHSRIHLRRGGEIPRTHSKRYSEIVIHLKHDT